VGEAIIEEEEANMERHDQLVHPASSAADGCLGSSDARPTAGRGAQKSNRSRPCNESTDVSFNAYDVDVLELMPQWIVQQYPFRATHRGALDLTLLELMKTLIVTEGSFQGVHKRLVELQHRRWYQSMLLYYTFATWLKQEHERKHASTVQGGTGQATMHAFYQGGGERLPEPPKFGDAADPEHAYTLYVPRAQYLSEAFLATTNTLQAFADKYMANLDGYVNVSSAMQHSFKAFVTCYFVLCFMQGYAEV
jgi:hypothetical protein